MTNATTSSLYYPFHRYSELVLATGGNPHIDQGTIGPNLVECNLTTGGEREGTTYPAGLKHSFYTKLDALCDFIRTPWGGTIGLEDITNGMLSGTTTPSEAIYPIKSEETIEKSAERHESSMYPGESLDMWDNRIKVKSKGVDLRQVEQEEQAKASDLIDAIMRLPWLTERQRQCLVLRRRGLTQKSIAQTLKVNRQTVMRDMAAAYRVAIEHWGDVEAACTRSLLIEVFGLKIVQMAGY